MCSINPTTINIAGSAPATAMLLSPLPQLLLPISSHADFPGHLVAGKVQLGSGLRPGRVVPEPIMLDLGFVLPGDLLEAGGTGLPQRRSAGVCWCLPGQWHLWKMRLYLPPGCWWKAECGAKSRRTLLCPCPCPAGVTAPGGQRRGCPHRGLSRQDPKAALTSCIAKGNQYREASREKLRPPASVAVPGSSLTHGGRYWWSRGAPGCWPAGAGGAGPVARVMWECGGCCVWLVDMSPRPRPSSGEREQCPELGEGWTRHSGCGPGRYQHPEVGGGMETSNHCPQALLRRGDIPLPASVISDREKLPVVLLQLQWELWEQPGSLALWCGPAQRKAAPCSLYLLALLSTLIK